MRIVFMGRPCEFARIPFHALLAARLDVVGLIIPSAGPAGDSAALSRRAPEALALPVLPLGLTELAAAHAVPLLEVRRLRDGQALAALDELRPDLICAACFPRRLPAEWLSRPRQGCLNIHPSLLPAYRGPEPLFWQFRLGEPRTGVSLHFMDEQFDTGDLVAQAAVPFGDGITGAEAERLTAEAGARLLIDALSGPARPRMPQPPQGASHQPRPARVHCLIDVDWPARRAFNFIRGAGEWAPFEIRGRGWNLPVRSALGFDPGATLDGPVLRDGQTWQVRFSDGVVTVA